MVRELAMGAGVGTMLVAGLAGVAMLLAPPGPPADGAASETVAPQGGPAVAARAPAGARPEPPAPPLRSPDAPAGRPGAAPSPSPHPAGASDAVPAPRVPAAEAPGTAATAAATARPPTSDSRAAVADAAPVAPARGAYAGGSGAATAAASPPAVGFAGEVPGVRSDRLPRIGDRPDPPLPGRAATAAAGAAGNPGAAALRRHAAASATDASRPMLAIVLHDDGLDPAVRARADALPFLYSIALDPAAPRVAEVAADHRAAGRELVLLATHIPAGATPADLEVTFRSHFAALPEAVAVMDPPDAGFGGDRRLVEQVTAILAGEGHGLLSLGQGLDVAGQVAARRGIPHARVFRSVAADAEPIEVRRVLDRAVFRAAQEGAAVVVVPARAPLLSAVADWQAAGRADRVALVPVSAVLLSGAP